MCNGPFIFKSRGLPQLLLLLPILLVFLSAPNAIADSTFYSVNILKALFSSTPIASPAFDNVLNLVLDVPSSPPASELPAFPPVSCDCGSRDNNNDLHM
jgi:hypothetical protein